MKKPKFFSFAIFKESFKSNIVSLSIVGVGNAIIALVVILILSTLSLNSTKQSMQNMFNTANLEHTLKLGSSGGYLAFSAIVEAHAKTLPEAENYLITAYDAYDTSISLLNGEYNSALTGFRVIYQGAYFISTADTEEAKHEEAKTIALDGLDTVLNLGDFSENELVLINEFAGNFLDEVHASPNSNLDGWIRVSLEESVKNFAETTLNLGEGVGALLYSSIESAEKKVDEDPENKQQIIQETITELAGFALDFDENIINTAIDIMLTNYLADTESYLNNTVLEGAEIGYKDETYFEIIDTIVQDLLNSTMYYEFLPDFEVDYITNELGEPIYYGANGEEVVIQNIADRDKLVPVKDNMGLYSNFLEKMHKEMITGTPYTEEEKAKAQEEAQEYFDTFYPLLREFYLEYLGNKDAYYDSTNQVVLKENIVSRVCGIVKEQAINIIPSFFGVASIDEVTKENIGLSGDDLLNKAYDYSLAAISIFDQEVKNELEEGRSTTDAMMIAINRASSSLIDELPADISFKLDDLASRNLYGLVVGVILFSIAGLLLPIVYSILTANGLVAQQVESGSLAFTLSAPIKRSTIIVSKAIYFIFAITSMFLVLFLFSVIGREIGIAIGGTDFIESLAIKDLALYSLGSYLVSLAISGICFLTSSIFNKSKYAIGVGGGISIFFLVASILGLFGSEVMPLALRIDSMNFFNYLTIISFFNVNSILNGTSLFYYLLIPLVAISVVTYVVGCYIFTKKDLPL